MTAKPGILYPSGIGPGKTANTRPAGSLLNGNAGNSVPSAPGIKLEQQIFDNPPLQKGGDVFRTAAFSLGLPQDILSSTLLAFTRFFSMAPDPGFMAAFRKQVLDSGSSSPKTAKERAALEVKVLAGLAAYDKGVSLSRERLEAYALVSGDPGIEDKGRPRELPFLEGFPGSEDLRQFFDNNPGEDSGKDKNRFLYFLNRIPGKNGQRWIVLPFNCSLGGTELTVLIRLLIREPLFSYEGKYEGEACIIADISGPKHSWRFFLNKTGPDLSLDVGVVPDLSPGEAKALCRELTRELGLKDIRIRKGEFPLAEKLGETPFPSVDKEA